MQKITILHITLAACSVCSLADSSEDSSFKTRLAISFNLTATKLSLEWCYTGYHHHKIDYDWSKLSNSHNQNIMF